MFEIKQPSVNKIYSLFHKNIAHERNTFGTKGILQKELTFALLMNDKNVHQEIKHFLNLLHTFLRRAINK